MVSGFESLSRSQNYKSTLKYKIIKDFYSLILILWYNENNMKIKIFFNIAKISIVLLAFVTLFYRITEIMLFRGTEGYSLPGNISGMMALFLLLVVFFIGLQKKQKWGFWYGLVLSIFLLLAYLFKTPFVWPYAVIVVLLLILIILLLVLKREFK